METYRLAINIIACCWILILVIWLVAAFWTKHAVYHESALRRLRYVTPLVLGGYLLVKGARLPPPLNLRVIPHSDLLAWISVLLCVSGFGFCIWARFTLGRNWSGIVALKADHELITTGPYALVRHPIYTGLLAMVLATVLLLGHVAGIVAMPILFVSIWIKLRYEEELMSKQFPKNYEAYQRRVKRLIPSIV